MQGKILDYIIQEQQGIITSESGDRYQFKIASWKESTHPNRGQTVDFTPIDGNIASDIYLTGAGAGGAQTDPSLTKSFIAIACSVLGFFIPVIGLILSIVGIVLGNKARRAGKEAGNETAVMIGLIAVIVGAISLIFAALGLIAIILYGGSLAFLGMSL
ncbi:hypothetical protein [Thalassobius sp. I31.1]|uniref:hypothetical protein n=1 Tax=Thalassobius sp. I31.1 TaxID=2109912 RepID=UPI000D1AAE9D|nr:hypothetical protein [Thalassobius sp. I31.1]